MAVKSTISVRLFAFILIISAAYGLSRAGVIYVDQNPGPVVRDGIAWETAHETLQDALAGAAAGDEIRVADGIYRPDQGVGQAAADINASFVLIDGVAVRGGYAGYGAADPNERNTDLYICVLSGDLLENDAPAADPCDLLSGQDRLDNSYHVVVGSGANETAVLDGFLVRGGAARADYPDNQGGGMLNISGSPTVTGCDFKDNAAENGAAIYCYGSGATLRNCFFTNNYAGQSGGAVRNANGSNTLIEGCIFWDNTAGMHGGAMSNYSGCGPMITDCDFSGNTAAYGGCINNYADCAPTVVDCVLNGNVVSIYGGAISNFDHSDCVIVNSVITENWAHAGAGVYNLNSNPRLYGCVLAGNRSAAYGTAVYSQFSDSTLAMLNCTLAGNRSDSDGAAVWNDSSSPVITNCIFWHNENVNGTDQSAQIHTEHGSPAVSYCCIQGWTGRIQGNFAADPLFLDAEGPDGKLGTLDDDLGLEAGSPCIDAGDNTSVPADVADLDKDGDAAERMPLDIEGRDRFVDYPDAVDAGVADLPDYPAIVDLGAREHRAPLLVDADAPGPAADGGSWQSAYTNLQDALAAASNGDEIWMAQGIYTPDVNSAEPSGTGNRQATFELIEAVSIRGGYGGFGADEPDLRDTAAFVTILSGDLLGNDGEPAEAAELSTDPNRADNCHHVVTARRTGAGTVLDGVVITGGYADAAAGETASMGGGIYTESGGCTVRNCFIKWNLASYGGGMYNLGGSAVVEACIFSDNFAYESGGAMRNNIGDRTSAKACTFRSNQSLVYGGAIANSDASDPVLTGCDFTANTAAFGGAVHSYNNSDPVMTDCTFSDNHAGTTGGAVRLYECGEPVISECAFSGNTADYGGAVYSFAGNPVISDCGFTDNSAITGGGAICESGGGCRVTGSLFSGNRSDNDGGALYVASSGVPVFDRCIFRGNIAVYDGGVMYNASASTPTMSNCLLIGNSAYSGGAISNKSSSAAVLINCTMSMNSAVGAGGIFNDGGGCSLLNCIVWGNQNSTQIFPPGSTDANYSCVQDYSGTGTGNISADPLFVDPTGPDGTVGTEDDDFRIGSGSPCLDTGDNSSLPPHAAADLEGRPRIVDGNCDDSLLADMGAYEFSYAHQGDLDGQCGVDMADLAVLARSWMCVEGDGGYSATSDISPRPADGAVDWLDLGVISGNWLMGLN